MNQFIANILETLINQALRLDPPSLQALNKLSGRIVRVELSGMAVFFTFIIDNTGIILFNDYDGEVDVHISGPPFTLLHLLLQREATLSNNPEVIINGKISVAQHLLSILKGLDLDWEEQLAQWLGDIPAHHLGTQFRQSQNYASERFNTLQLNISEYLQEETRHLPARAEMEILLNAVDTLRDDLERLEQRVQRLQKHLPTS